MDQVVVGSLEIGGDEGGFGGDEVAHEPVVEHRHQPAGRGGGDAVTDVTVPDHRGVHP
jgi:hypothetical protein